jgi:hypothetical protein
MKVMDCKQKIKHLAEIVARPEGVDPPGAPPWKEEPPLPVDSTSRNQGLSQKSLPMFLNAVQLGSLESTHPC